MEINDKDGWVYDPDAKLAEVRQKIVCPICGHYSHRTRACRGGMGDYCGCQYDSQEETVVLTDEQLSQGTFNCPVCGRDTPHHH
jgi:competence CoiA-like predicted nuclease